MTRNISIFQSTQGNIQVEEYNNLKRFSDIDYG